MKNENYYVIYNPISGNGKSKLLLNKLKYDLSTLNKTFQITKTEYPGHTKEICSNLTSYEKVIIIGGDGTFSEAINGFMQNTHKPTLGFLPGGTGNAMMHDLQATKYSEAFNLIINEKKKKIDVMQLNFFNKLEYSFNIVGWGMAADINQLAEKLRFLGSSRYTLASIYYVFNKISRKATVTIDNQEIMDNFLFILILNTIHTGKGMKAAPLAKLNDGLLDIVILKSSITKLELLFLLPKLFTGKHILSKKIEYIQAKEISIFPDKEEILNIDGDMRCNTPVTISVIPQSLTIFTNT